MDTLSGLSSSFLFDSSIDRSSNSNSTSSMSPSGSPPLASLLSGMEPLNRPSWLFNNQSVYSNQSTPTEALSSILDSFSPVSSPSNNSLNQVSGYPYKQMTNRAPSSRRPYGGVVSPASENGNPLGAPGMPINGSNMSVNGNGSAASTPAPKNPKLYKTELCRSWMEHGRCNYGERCQYAHGECEKRQIPRHPKYKTEACQSFHQTGYCPYGPRCHFIHNEMELLNQPSSAQSNLNMFTSSSPKSVSGGSGTGGSSMTPSVQNIQSSFLHRMSSLPNYGSAGESSSGSSNDSGSESPNGSFSSGLDNDDCGLGTFTGGFMTPQSGSRRQAQRYQSVYEPQTEPISVLLTELMAFKVQDDKWSNEENPSRLPVFAQLSAK
ncbi:unnamed protein product [Auanema sp. JU1783]|nr:unnamed protein product [Auanema sp. JU1783]